MEVLMMIIVKDGVWLPGLPPVRFEVYARMVDDAVVISVEQYSGKWHWNEAERKLNNTHNIVEGGTGMKQNAS
jgi:hypothetical protein